MAIRLGTSGWRAVIADGFTFAGLRQVTEAICAHFGTSKESQKPVIIGHDSFLGERFAPECAGIVSAHGFRTLLCNQPTPTPTISHAIRSEKPNQLIAVLFDYLAESRNWTGGVARSVATSHLVDRVAEARGLPVYETPVGFKFIGELINEDKIILGGEESAGLSIKGHYPEKDGILACLLAAEAVAARGESLTQQLTKLYARVDASKLDGSVCGSPMNL